MTTVNAIEARAQLYTLIDETTASHQPIMIKGKRSNAINETLYLVSIPGMRESIIKGMQTPVSDCRQELDWQCGNWPIPRQAQKDVQKLGSAGLKGKAQKLLEILCQNPFQNPPPYEKLVGDLQGAYSRRINIQHRLIYQILERDKTVKILRLWTHYS